MSKNNGKANIVELYQDGMSVTKIARRKRVSTFDVYRVLKSSGFSASSARADKRLDAAERVRNGELASEVLLDCGRSAQWLRSACHEHKVACHIGETATVSMSTFAILAALQNDPRKTLQAIADDHGLTRQRIGQILTEGRNSGMLFPGRPTHPGNRPHCSMTRTETTK